MQVVAAVDIGGTKLAGILADRNGSLLFTCRDDLRGRPGMLAGEAVVHMIRQLCSEASAHGWELTSLAFSVPGICHADGTVWVPNISGWEAFPLLNLVRQNFPGIIIAMESDRCCYIRGEHWLGAARNCSDAIYLAVGTGIGAGIMAGGHILRGAGDVAGSVGWMALQPFFEEGFTEMGCFESQASGTGIALQARRKLVEWPHYQGTLRQSGTEGPTAAAVMEAFAGGDEVAVWVMRQAVSRWGMAIANLISLFNPEIIVLGGGVFGPAGVFLDDIRREALRWAQPVSGPVTRLALSTLGPWAGALGAAHLAWQQIETL